MDKQTEERQIQEEKAESVKRDSDKLGKEPVHPLLLKMSAPLMVSMFVMALYNIVDSIYLGNYNTDSLAAVSYVFPFQSLNIAFGIGSAVGMSALLSRYLGAKEYEKADKVAHNGFIIAAINYVPFFIVGCLAGPIMTRVVTGDTGIITSEAIVYLRITQWLSIAPMVLSMFERLLQSTGKTNYITSYEMAVQSYGDTAFSAATLNELVIEAMDNLLADDRFSRIHLNNSQMQTDTTRKLNRYQSTFEIVMM